LIYGDVMIDKHMLYIEILFLISLFISLFVPSNLFLKLLFVILLILFVIKEKENYVYNSNHYLFVGAGLSVISLLFVFAGYISNFIYLTILICAVVLFVYLSKVLFYKTYGTIIHCRNKEVEIRIDDVFFKSKKNLIFKTNKKLVAGTTVLVRLSKYPFGRKPIAIEKIIINSEISSKKH